MGISQWNSDNKLTTLLITVILNLDSAMMQLDKRTCQVEADACTKVALVSLNWRLIEALENLVLLVLWNTRTCITDSYRSIFSIVG